MASRRSELKASLTEAARLLDRDRVAEITEYLVDDIRASSRPYSIRDARLILDELRAARRFDLMLHVADVLMLSGQDSFLVRRQYAQALLDQGSITPAIDTLVKLVRDTRSADKTEHLEARGLLGRAYKQIYMGARGGRSTWVSNALKQSVLHYYKAYEEDPKRIWHGINAAALLQRAKRDGLRLRKYPEPGALAAEILVAVQRKDSRGQADAWDLATAAEASIALNDYDAALRWINRVVIDESVTAFHLGSFERQLREVWGLYPSTPPGSQMLSVVRTQRLAREGTCVKVTGEEIQKAPRNREADEAQLQKILGRTGVRSYRWWLKGLSRARYVARVGYDIDRGEGTGFLVQASTLHASLGDEFVLITNAHVISDDPDVDALRSDEAVVTFEAGGGVEQPFRIVDVVFSSPPGKLDTTIVRLDRDIECAEPFPVNRNVPTPDKSRVYVIGHPQGESLSFSIQDNLLLGHKGKLLHYRTPTEPGSSGSPVFNANWDLIGIHHAGGHNIRTLDRAGTYAANEGIWIESVRRELSNSLSTE